MWWLVTTLSGRFLTIVEACVACSSVLDPYPVALTALVWQA
jgi:hypothetical protein